MNAITSVCFTLIFIANILNKLEEVRKLPSPFGIFVLWRGSLNSDGHQHHQYQQNEQSPFIVTQWTKTRPLHMTLECNV
jgi:hypothetical protein